MVSSGLARGFREVLAGTLFLLACGPAAVEAEEKITSPAEARLKNDVSFLADDAREGRAPGTKGIEAAADYIAAAFKDAGPQARPGRRGILPAVHDRRRPDPAGRLRAAPRAGRTGRRSRPRRRPISRPLAIGSRRDA